MILKKLVTIVAAVFFMFAFVGCSGGGGESVVDIDTNQSTTSNSPPSNNTPSNNTTNSSSTPSECTDSWQTSADIDETRKTGADLFAVYNQISKGMSPDQVMGLIGSPPAKLIRINGYVNTLFYQSTNGADLLLTFEALCSTPQNRITGKTVVTFKGTYLSHSEYYSY